MKFDSETDTLKIKVMPEGYIYTVVKGDVSLRLSDLEQFVVEVKKLLIQQPFELPMPVMVDITAAKSMDKAARDFAKTEESVHQCVALITKSAVSKIIGNFFVGLSKAKFPLKLFTDEVSARQWILKQI